MYNESYETQFREEAERKTKREDETYLLKSNSNHRYTSLLRRQGVGVGAEKAFEPSVRPAKVSTRMLNWVLFAWILLMQWEYAHVFPKCVQSVARFRDVTQVVGALDSLYLAVCGMFR